MMAALGQKNTGGQLEHAAAGHQKCSEQQCTQPLYSQQPRTISVKTNLHMYRKISQCAPLAPFLARVQHGQIAKGV